MLRSIHALGARRRIILSLATPLVCGLRTYAAAAPAAAPAARPNGKVSVRNAPIATSNIGRKFNKNFRRLRDERWKKKKAKSNRRKTAAGRRSLTAKEMEVKLRKLQRKREREAATTKARKAKKMAKLAKQHEKGSIDKKDGDDDGRPGDFLFRYGRLNLGEQGLTRPVAPPIMEAMYRLFITDEDFWTPTRLGTKFGFSYEMTTGIILLMSYEKFIERKHEKKLALFKQQEELRKLQCQKDRKRFLPRKKPVNHLLSDDLELAMGEEFGWMTTEGIAPKPPGGFGLFSDIALVGDQFDMGLLARASFKVAPPPHELPSKTPSIYIPERIISGPTRANKLFRSKLLIVDIEKRKGKDKGKDDQRFMMIRELDGTLRIPSWQERLNIQKHYIRRHRAKGEHEATRDPLGYYSFLRPPRPYPGNH